ncbi:TPA: mechanosensitive channel MscK [Pasteurella multocida]|nr:mechanosensitive channel MscK [Pasteurella multocida]HDR1922284.1 mechanosensitive channel MscK [Pasteurella multocida]HDR1928672.1 mechanosensitive channel MscK [Pasteurella multocida]HED4464210.1 mechanosensitive channel MscK [Pasteurella multocida]HED4474332.1 mechanosensitive channel MscK [Pasteurella multocida]
MKKTHLVKKVFFALSLCFMFNAYTFAQLPTPNDIQAQLKVAKSAEQNDTNSKTVVQNLEETLALLAKIDKQKADIKDLEARIDGAAEQTTKAQKRLETLKSTPAPSATRFEKLSLADLQAKLLSTQQALQQIQVDATGLNTELVTLRTAPERAQVTLNANLTRVQEINKLLANADTIPSGKVKLETELALLELQNSFNKLLLQGNNVLTTLYTLELEDKNLEVAQLQEQIKNLQDAINQKYLKESQQQVEQLTKSQLENKGTTHPEVASQLEQNVRLSQALVQQTTEMNTLSQDNLRIKNVLNNLQQTQRNIEDQISALQGSLVLSRIINKQKELLPQDEMIAGLSKRITDLRVRIFDLTEMRDNLYDPQSYISALEKKQQVAFSAQEKASLDSILQERRKLLSDIISLLNNQLNLVINIELNQKQVALISDQLQSKLQQQSFWVKSNAPMDVDWVKQFLPAVQVQVTEIIKQIDFSNWREDLVPAALIIALLLVFTFLIQLQKAKIKQRLTNINQKINTLTSDSQWHTPEAILWTLVLCLPSTFIFTALLVFMVYLCFAEPLNLASWVVSMGGYWCFFAFMLSLLRPNGIAYRHFSMPKESVDRFYRVFGRSVWISALWINASLFTHLETGITNDVIGQVMTISVLFISLLIIGPRIQDAVKSYENSSEDNTKSIHMVLKIGRFFLVAAPIILIVLVVMGYYYTALNLMEHLMSSYFVVVTWLVLKNVIHRGLTVSSRRLSYNRLKEKIEQQAQPKVNTEEELNIGLELQQSESLGIAQVKDQVLRVTDLLLTVILLGMLYWVWSDLVTVAYYLQGVTLWQQSVTTAAGTVMESITLLNLLLAVVILIAMYALVRNIGGLLEVLVFSRVSFSQGTPYTITTLATYFIIAIGAGVAFSTLGMSWSKLQWLFAALSVGLGFGLQEIFANFVSGLIILFERPVRIGDVITIGEYSGTVSRIRIRSTTLIDFDRKEVIVPNKAFVTERLVNWALNDSVTRVVIRVGVGYGSDLELTKRLLLQAATECDRVLKDPEPVVYFLNFGASSLDHELRLYVGKLADRNPTVDCLNRRINSLFEENNIEISFNQLDVFIKNQVTNEEIKLNQQCFPTQKQEG